jgi:putative FmdB family regulatory protein
MPTYDYECSKCGGTFEFFQSMKDEPLKTCPEGSCLMEEWGRGDIKRLLGTGAGLLFKGSGFYITDYRSDSYKQAAKKETGTGGDAKKAAPKADKPAASTPTPKPAGGSSSGS